MYQVRGLLYSVKVSTHRFLDINVTKNVHSRLQQIDPARNLKKWKEQVYLHSYTLHVMFYYHSACLHLGKTKDNFSTYTSSNILGFINTVYFTSDNVPHGIKNTIQYIFEFPKKVG
jgi:hypothetical protein